MSLWTWPVTLRDGTVRRIVRLDGPPAGASTLARSAAHLTAMRDLTQYAAAMRWDVRAIGNPTEGGR